jgi:hypothetical protein
MILVLIRNVDVSIKPSVNPFLDQHIFVFERDYRITAVLKVETDIIFSITVSPIGWAVVLVIIYVETFKTDILLFLLVNHNAFVVTLTNNFHLKLTICFGEITGGKSPNYQLMYITNWTKTSLPETLGVNITVTSPCMKSISQETTLMYSDLQLSNLAHSYTL